jgi:hypothetical protein
MKRPLAELMKGADAWAGEPLPAAPGLAGRVGRLARRRRAVRIAGASGAAGLVLLAAAAGAWRWAKGPSPGAAPRNQIVRQEPGAAEAPPEAWARLARLTAEGDARAAVIAEALALQERDQRMAKLRDLLWDLGAADPLERREEQAARTLFLAASRVDREFENRPSAVEAYERIIREFPQTPFAVMARERATALQNIQGEPS